MSRRAAAEIKQKDLGGALCMALSGHDLLVAPVWLAGNLVLLAGMAAARLFRVRTAAPRRLAARRRFAAWQTIGSPSLARSRHFPRIRKIRKNPLTVAPSPVGIILASTDSNLAFRRVVYSPFVRTCRQGWLRSGARTLEVEAMMSTFAARFNVLVRRRLADRSPRNRVFSLSGSPGGSPCPLTAETIAADARWWLGDADSDFSPDRLALASAAGVSDTFRARPAARVRVEQGGVLNTHFDSEGVSGPEGVGSAYGVETRRGARHAPGPQNLPARLPRATLLRPDASLPAPLRGGILLRRGNLGLGRSCRAGGAPWHSHCMQETFIAQIFLRGRRECAP